MHVYFLTIICLNNIAKQRNKKNYIKLKMERSGTFGNVLECGVINDQYCTELHKQGS